MQIVIDIPEEDYKGICHLKNEQLRMLPEEVAETLIRIASGISLPKGHGVLKDADGLLEMTKSYKSELGSLKADPFVKSGIETVEGFIKEMPTIIEADKAEKKDY